MKHFYHCLKISRGMLGPGKAFSGPLWVQIGISDSCNHRCIMCWDHPSFPLNSKAFKRSNHSEKDKVLSAKETDVQSAFMSIDMIGDLARDLKAIGTRRIELAGRGEPTLHPKFNHIVQVLKDKKFSVGVVTNGSLLDSSRCEHLVDSGVDRIVVSLNAGSGDTYPKIHTTANALTFHKIIKSLLKLRATKKHRQSETPAIALSFVISRLNYREVMRMIECGRIVGADQIIFKYAITYPNISFIALTSEEKKSFSNQLPELVAKSRQYNIDLKVEPPIGEVNANASSLGKKTETIYSKIPCYIGWLFALITARGSVFPCCQCSSEVGNLQHQSFYDIWYSDHYKRFREKTKNFPLVQPISLSCECDDCSFEKINTSAYNILHFYRPIRFHSTQLGFSLRQLLPSIINGKTARLSRRHKA